MVSSAVRGSQTDSSGKTARPCVLATSFAPCPTSPPPVMPMRDVVQTATTSQVCLNAKAVFGEGCGNGGEIAPRPAAPGVAFDRIESMYVFVAGSESVGGASTFIPAGTSEER